MTIHYYRIRNGGLIEHSPRTDVAAEEITVDRASVEPLLGWPTDAMAIEVDEDGEPTGWYVGTDPDGNVTEDESMEIAALLHLMAGAVTVSDDNEAGRSWVWAGYTDQQVPGDGTRECRMLVDLGVLLADDPTDGYHCYEIAPAWRQRVRARLVYHN